MLRDEDWDRMKRESPVPRRRSERQVSMSVLRRLTEHVVGRHEKLTQRGDDLRREEKGRLAETIELLALLRKELTYAMETMVTPGAQTLPYLLRDVEATLDAQAEMEAAKRLF